MVNGNNKFAFDLYRTVKSSKGNIFFSPYSISMALAMTYGGAQGTTEKQIRDVLHFEKKEMSFMKVSGHYMLKLMRRKRKGR
jgi:serine protease inhibitor